MGRVKGKMLPCRRLRTPSEEKVLDRLNELSKTEKERVNSQVLARAMHSFTTRIFFGRKTRRVIQERKGLSLGQQFMIFLLVMLMAFVFAISIGALVRANKLRQAPAVVPHYKLIEQL